MMIPAALAKASFGFAATVLFLQNRISPMLFGVALVDLIFVLLFIVAYLKTADRPE